MIVATTMDNSDDMDEVNESMAGITLLELGDGDNFENDIVNNEEQLDAIGAIRAVQKKVIRVADEAKLSTTFASGDHEISSSQAKFSGSSVDEDEMNQSRSTVSKKDHAVKRPEDGKDENVVEEIYFSDSLDSSFTIPYHLVQSWPVSTASDLLLGSWLISMAVYACFYYLGV